MKTDSQLQKDVMDELNYEPLLRAAEIGVSAKDGVITLTGTVDGYTKKLEAEDAAKKTDQPVKDVAQYTGAVATGSVKTVGTAAKETTEAGVSPLVAFWNWMTGKGKPEKVVTEPVERSGKAVANAVVNTGKTIVGQNK